MEPHYTNNFALSILAGPTCCQGNNTDPQHLTNAKALVNRFTFVLDMECLEAGMKALAESLKLGIQTNATIIAEEEAKQHHLLPGEVYDFLLERNHLDIELYKWSKTVSLVDCSSLDLE